ncbi:uncharacterized protein LTR77_000404 [Saxophila tyrrhenica]|uniref:Heterokaryon incompatibility domain-containing protein n=1 Tax=Saxophila tyrrhenica TaxID=1690608 RepID=A0AAV9PQR2_9PEZI|nr:hypothetical protein LTR77_000404 [Saxophila tyrrhenica]
MSREGEGGSRGEYVKDILSLKASQQYKYSNLQADREIRLFKFARGCNAATIRLTIERVSLEDLPEYECISYVWGDPSETRPVYVGQDVICVTTNLWNALQRLIGEVYDERNEWRFWADQISINQSCLEERADQVPLMSQIFPRARRVICWLGEEDETTAAAVLVLDAWCKARHDEALRLQLSEDLSRAIAHERHDEVTGIKALRNLFTRDWFNRMWTLQEIFVSNTTGHIVLCGSYAVSWNNVCIACMTMTNARPMTDIYDVFGDNFDNVVMMFTIYLGEHESDWIRMSTLLPDAKLRKASDARDRVYALLGIAEHKGYRYPKPDYGKNATPAHVLTKYTRAIIQQERSLDIMGIKKQALSDGILPSWVFDPNNAGGGLLRERGLNARRRGAASSFEPAMEALGSTSDNNCSIGLYGRDIGRISKIVDFDQFYERIDPFYSRWEDLIAEGKRLGYELGVGHTYHVTSEGSVAAVLKTLAINDLWLGCPTDAKGYTREKRRLHEAFLQWRHTPIQDESDAIAGPFRHDADHDWSQDSLFDFARSHFRFEGPAECNCLDTSGEYQGSKAQLLKWLETYICVYLRLRLADTLHYMHLSVTDTGLLALVPHMSTLGDRVCVLLGGFSCFVLRASRDESSFRLLGPSYVHGSEDGRFLQDYETFGDTSSVDRFNLV